MINKVILVGNIGNEPEARILGNGESAIKTVNLRLATTERWKDRSGETKESTEWHNIVLWRGNAEFASKYAHKGSQAYVEGKIKTREWTDQQGQKRYVTEIVADTFKLLGKKEGGAAQAPAEAPAQAAPAAEDFGFMPGPEDFGDLPM